MLINYNYIVIWILNVS